MTAPVVCPFTILVSGAEKARYWFAGITADADQGHRPLVVPTEWSYLKTGDYTIKGMESLVTVERKSLEDLYSTLGSHRDRFEREHERMAAMQYACVVIEATWPQILTEKPARSALHAKTVYRTAISWSQKYGVPWLAIGPRELAENFTFRTLQKFWEQQQ